MNKRIIDRSKSFDKAVKRLKDKTTKIRLWKQISKVIEDPNVGDFLKNDKKGVRKIYIPSFRLLYRYHNEENKIELIDFDNRDKIYQKK